MKNSEFIPHIEELLKDGKTYRQISEYVGLTLKQVKGLIKKSGLNILSKNKKDIKGLPMISKDELIKYLKEGLSLHKIAEITGKSYTTVKYFFKKFDVKEHYCYEREYENRRDSDLELIKCAKCDEIKKTDEFFKKSNRKNKLDSYCRECNSKDSKERRRKFKKECIDYKGGKCIICGYGKYQGALDFHHLDINEKDFNISHIKKVVVDDFVKIELDKCVLLCANCHREVHGGISIIPPEYRK